MKFKIIKTDIMHNGNLLKENSFVEFPSPPEELAQFLVPIVEHSDSPKENSTPLAERRTKTEEPISSSQQSHEEVPIASSPKKNNSPWRKNKNFIKSKGIIQ